MKSKDISDLILEYFSDDLQLDENPLAARRRLQLQKKIIKFAKDRQIELSNPDDMDEAYPDFYLDNEWFDHKHLR